MICSYSSRVRPANGALRDFTDKSQQRNLTVTFLLYTYIGIGPGKSASRVFASDIWVEREENGDDIWQDVVGQWFQLHRWLEGG
jgi:hypothetical protein